MWSKVRAWGLGDGETRLVSPAARSPIVERGQAPLFYLGLGINLCRPGLSRPASRPFGQGVPDSATYSALLTSSCVISLFILAVQVFRKRSPEFSRLARG